MLPPGTPLVVCTGELELEPSSGVEEQEVRANTAAGIMVIAIVLN